MVYGDGFTSSQTYDGNGNVATSTDDRNKVESFTNDALGRVLSDTKAGVTASTQFDAAGEVFKTFDGNNVETDINHDSRGDVTSETTAVGTASAETTKFAYNSDGIETGTTDPNNNISTTSESAGGDVTSSKDALGNQETTIRNSDGEVIAQIDARNHLTTFRYDSLGREIWARDTVGVTTTAYDDVLNTKTVTDPALNVTVYYYDNLDREIQVKDPDGKSAYTSYDENGNILTTTDKQGRITKYLYDPLGQKTGAIEDFGTPLQRTVSETFDGNGNVTSTTDELTHTTSATFDDLNRVLSGTDANNKTTSETFDANGNVLTSTDANGKVTTNVYDSENRLISSTDSNGHKTQNTYDSDNNLVVSTDAAGNTTHNFYDADNRLIFTVAANGAITQRKYDGSGNLIALTDPDNNTTTWQYNAANQVILQTDPTGAQTATTYDGDGRVATVTDALGRQKINAYDNNGWLLSQTWKDSSGTVVDVQRYTWNSDGTLATASNNAGTYTFGYDGDGRVASITDPNNITLNYGYDAASNMTSITDNRGATVASTFDPTNQLSSRSLSGSGVSSPLSVQFTRDNNGSVTQTRRYSDATGTNLVSTTDFGRDPVGNLTSQTHKGTGGTTVATYTNIFDALNRIASETRNGVVNNFGYDAVIEVTSAGNQNYSYTQNGNRNSAGYTVGVWNQITSDGTWNYGYNAVGNVVRMTKIADGSYWTFAYNFNNQVTSAQLYNSSNSLQKQVDYVYDVFGNTISRTVTISGISTTQKFAYDVSGASIGINAHINPIWADLDSNGNIITRYLTDDSGTLLARTGSAGTFWLLTDRLGSVREVLDGGGNLVDAVSYDTSGNITSETNSAITGEWGQGGSRIDRTTGFVMDNYRFVLPDGQFSGVDEKGFTAGDANDRRLVGNNGANLTDPSGLGPYSDAKVFQNRNAPQANGNPSSSVSETKRRIWICSNTDDAVGTAANGHRAAATLDSLVPRFLISESDHTIILEKDELCIAKAVEKMKERGLLTEDTVITFLEFSGHGSEVGKLIPKEVLFNAQELREQIMHDTLQKTMVQEALARGLPFGDVTPIFILLQEFKKAFRAKLDEIGPAQEAVWELSQHMNGDSEIRFMACRIGNNKDYMMNLSKISRARVCANEGDVAVTGTGKWVITAKKGTEVVDDTRWGSAAWVGKQIMKRK